MANKNIKSDLRVSKINQLLVHFSHGNFTKKLIPSKSFDEIDAIMFSLNMLGEEMESTTISKNYFMQVFDSIKEMIFELDKNGVIINFNKSVERKLGWNMSEIINKNIFEFLHNPNLFNPKLNKVSFKKIAFQQNIFLDIICKNKKQLYCICQIQEFEVEKNKKVKYLFTAKNISKEREIEKSVMLNILNAQEMDRSRLAKDLHDSIGQQLSAIKLYLGSMQNLYTKDELSTPILLNCNNLLNNISQEIRNICFDLMPRTLHDAGLFLAIKELSHQINYTDKIKVIVKIESEKSLINSNYELVIYRVIQEFINNSIKHSNCTKIMITIANILNKTHIVIKDNGKGFDQAMKNKGMGLMNMENRIKSINGKIKIKSVEKKGTQLQILL